MILGMFVAVVEFVELDVEFVELHVGGFRFHVFALYPDSEGSRSLLVCSCLFLAILLLISIVLVSVLFAEVERKDVVVVEKKLDVVVVEHCSKICCRRMSVDQLAVDL